MKVILQYKDREALVNWAAMHLERVDVTAEVLADLLQKAYDDGKKAGYEDGKRSDFEFKHFGK
jgi:hypothetical protein